MGWLESLDEAVKRDPSGLDPGERRKISEDLVMLSSLGAAAVTYVPVPLSDFFLVTPVQASMVMSVGRVHGRKIDLAEARRILLELAAVCGVGILAQKGFATLSKILLPGLGGLLAGPYAFAVTYGLGKVSIRYFESGGAAEGLKAVFEEAVRDGRRLFSREKVAEFRKRRGQDVEEFARKHAAKAPRRAAKARTKAAKKAPKRAAKASRKGGRA